MMRIALIAMVSIATMIGCFDRPECVKDTGTVVFVGFEDGFYGIVDDHGRSWEPSNLPERFQVDSLRVRFEAVITDSPSFRMWGRTVELQSIELLEIR